jgi:exodeoxyribonuclease VII small subunit
MPLSPSPTRPDGETTTTTVSETAPSGGFEAAYRELQQVVAQLEDGGALGLDLERAVRLFERGNQLVRVCERIVDEAELRVTRLAAESASPLSDAPHEQQS